MEEITKSDIYFIIESHKKNEHGVLENGELEIACYINSMELAWNDWEANPGFAPYYDPETDTDFEPPFSWYCKFLIGIKSNYVDNETSKEIYLIPPSSIKHFMYLYKKFEKTNFVKQCKCDQTNEKLDTFSECYIYFYKKKNKLYIELDEEKYEINENVTSQLICAFEYIIDEISERKAEKEAERKEDTDICYNPNAPKRRDKLG